MDRYSTYSRTSTTARNAGTAGSRGAGHSGGYTDVETDVVDGGATYRRRAEPQYRYGADSEIRDYDAYESEADASDADEYDYDDIYEYEDPIDRRWVWVAGVAGAILLIAVICTVVILGGGDSGSVSKTIAASTPTTAPQDASTTAPRIVTSAAPPPSAIAPLSPETVTTVAPSPSATATAAVPVPTEVAPPSPQTITYHVNGTRPLLDMVTVVYTDAQGALQTEFNVALPWSRTVTLDPGVQLKSVIATSLTGRLNCAVTDAAGATLVAQNASSMIATCTQ
ncbi:MmpS family transport accessory protein [Mycolicibacterium sp.]|uniref:MmpS family transport accessory protein n=1 Tax=Mycolicibacterium sp. TaxID=2320850 RepID=UPI001A28B56C|nr:MmpS family transport accessory protein [Mycolicibacterium sp.]MBJ7339858.1 hypothetical protein [Mycolicibacterium sp.]